MLGTKQGRIKNNFCVFGMTRPGIETWSPGLLANTLLIRPMFDNTLKPFNSMQTNEWFEIEFLILNNNTWINLTVRK